MEALSQDDRKESFKEHSILCCMPVHLHALLVCVTEQRSGEAAA